MRSPQTKASRDAALNRTDKKVPIFKLAVAKQLLRFKAAVLCAACGGSIVCEQWVSDCCLCRQLPLHVQGNFSSSYAAALLLLFRGLVRLALPAAAEKKRRVARRLRGCPSCARP